MADNIEDFLRRAAERRQQRGAKPPAAAPTQQRSAPPPPPPTAPPPQSVVRQSAPPQQQTPNRPMQQEPRQSKKQKNQQFQTNVETRQKLAQSVETADDTMRDHLTSVFTHQLGNIAGNKPVSGTATQSPKPADSGAQDMPTDSLAQQLLAALRDPKTTKLAFIASEVFQRRF